MAVLVIVLFVSFIWASWLPQVAISKVVVAGTSSDTSADIEDKVQQVLAQKYFGIFPKKNFLLYPKGQIAALVMKQHPEVGSVSISTEHVSTLNIRLAERSPAALWCKGSVCYMVDKNAYIYALEASSSPSGVDIASSLNLIPVYDRASATGTASLVGNTAMPAKEFSEILSAAHGLSSSSLPVEDIYIENDGKYVFKIVKNGTIIFSDKKPVQESLEDLMSALQSPVFATSDAFQYIDTRFGNKVFYRLGGQSVDKEITGGEITASTSSSTPSGSVANASSSARSPVSVSKPKDRL